MGYSYGRTASGRSALSCDNCGGVGDTRKRVCPHKVLCSSHRIGGQRHALPYCPAPAVCSACWKTLGGNAVLHGEKCREGAAASQALSDAEQALIDAGAALRRAAWGDWQGPVPKGMVGVLFSGPAGDEAHLVTKAAYDAIPIGVPATPDDYRALQLGPVTPIDAELLQTGRDEAVAA